MTTLACSYSTVADVFAAYPMIGSVTAIGSAGVALAISTQQARIDARLAGRYAVPFADAPPVISSIATQLAVHQLLTQRVFTGERGATSEWPDAAWKWAIDMLDALSAGSAFLISGSGTIVETTIAATGAMGEVWSDTMCNTPVMNRGEWAEMG